MKRVFLVLFNLCVDLFLSLRDKIVEKHKSKQARKFQREVFKNVRHEHSIGMTDDLVQFVDKCINDPDWYNHQIDYIRSCQLNSGPDHNKKEKGNAR